MRCSFLFRRRGPVFWFAFVVSLGTAVAQQTPPLPAGLDPVFSGFEPDISSSYGLVYVPLDSWVYPAFERLFSLGYADSAYLGMRPWTRTSCLQILQETYPRLELAPQDTEAWNIFQALAKEFGTETGQTSPRAEISSLYTRNMYIKGRPINDSFHFGQTIINDDGRPYQEGFNSIDGFTARAEGYHFSLNVRGEYQHAPGRAAYPGSVQALIAQVDNTPLQASDPVAPTNVFRLIDANFATRSPSMKFPWARWKTGGGLRKAAVWRSATMRSRSMRCASIVLSRLAFRGFRQLWGRFAMRVFLDR